MQHTNLSIRVALVLLLLCAAGAGARDLSGRLFVGPGLGLYVEEEHSIVGGLLRVISAANAQGAVVDLAPSIPAPRFFFVGKDMGVYAACDDGCGATRRVGDASDPSRVVLSDGVKLTLASDALQPFEGTRPTLTLKVKTPSSLPEAPGATPASMSDWLAHLDVLWAAGPVARAAANSVLDAMVASLPQGPDTSAESMDRLAELTRWVQEGHYQDSAPLRVLVRQVRQKVAQELVATQPRSADLEKLHGIYSTLESELERR